MTRLLASTAVLLFAAQLTACGGQPAQIIDYSPQRGSVDVSTAAPIKITFDHDVDRASVESRLHLQPETVGEVHWLNGHQLTYQHATLRPSAVYEVILEAGYRDLVGNTYALRHHWSFVTEAPPAFTSSSPTSGETGIDPAAYLFMSFTREMNVDSLKSAVTITPTVPFDVRVDPSDSRRVIIAPSQLLAAGTSYSLGVTTAATDVDGNELGRFQSVTFKTGTLRPLHGWITFSTTGLDGSSGGLWLVDESGFPRKLFNSISVHNFSWSPAGDSLLIQGDQESWWELSPGSDATALNFKGPWAAALAPGMGYIYIDDAQVLHRVSPAHNVTEIASRVSEASVAPFGSRALFIAGAPEARSIWGYDVGLNTTYLLASDSAPVFNAAWAPNGNRIAYLREDPTGVTVRVRNLVGNAVTSTVVTANIDALSWLADSTHIVVGVGQVQTHKAFVINALLPPPTLAATTALPTDPTIDVLSPEPSPDGHQIAFLNAGQVWLMNADGTRPIALTKLDAESFPYSCQALAWTRS